MPWTISRQGKALTERLGDLATSENLQRVFLAAAI
jgi:hypothetical protein